MDYKEQIDTKFLRFIGILMAIVGIVLNIVGIIMLCGTEDNIISDILKSLVIISTGIIIFIIGIILINSAIKRSRSIENKGADNDR